MVDEPVRATGQALPPFQNPVPGKTVIIGCNGRMGSMFMHRALLRNINVCGIDRPLEETGLSEACASANLALLCVPARNFAEIAAKIVRHLPADAILADITSVKESPMRKMEELWPGPVVGTHPLFGPRNREGDDLPVALVRGKCATLADLALVSGFFQALGCRVFESSALKHDQAMARIQNMNFITNLAYFAVLADQEDLLPFLTPSFERRKKAAAKMLTEDAEMFAGLFEANGHSHAAVRQYRKMLNIAASGDVDLLCKKARWWWDKPDTKK